MSRSFALRLLETFFRRWWLCVVPAVLLTGVGVQSVVTAESKYLSRGVLYVESETLLSKLTGADLAPNNAYQTPSEAANNRLTSLLGTDEFIRSIVDRAGLTDVVNGGLLTLGQIRASIGTGSPSPNTLDVSASSVLPQVAFRLTGATIDSFIEWVIDASLSDSATAESFLQSLAVTYKADLETTTAARNKYLNDHPDPALGSRPLAQTIEINRLTEDVTAAQNRYTDTLGKAEDARLASAQTRSNVAGRLRLVDKPEVPLVSTLTRKDLVMRFAMFLILGLALTAFVVFVGTVTDKTLRSPEEIRDRLGVPLLAIVPENRSLGRSGRRRSHAGL